MEREPSVPIREDRLSRHGTHDYLNDQRNQGENVVRGRERNRQRRAGGILLILRLITATGQYLAAVSIRENRSRSKTVRESKRRNRHRRHGTAWLGIPRYESRRAYADAR